MKKILIGVGALLGLLVVAVVAAPFLIDPNIFKPTIIAKVKEATGRDLVIDGPLKLSIFPTPVVSAEGVRFSNMESGKAPQMVELKAVRAGVSLLPLLSRRVEVDELRLIEPKIVLEVAADGRANYTFRRSDGTVAAPGGTAPGTTTTASDGSKFTVAIDRIVIENGTLTYSDAVGRREDRVEKIALTLTGSSLGGPFALAGTMTANGVPVTVDGKVGARTAQGLPVDLQVKTPDGDVKLTGSASELTPSARFAGKAKLDASDLATFVRGLATAAGLPAITLPPALARKVAFDGTVETSADAITARDFKLTLGEDQGSGTLSVALKPAMRVEGKLSFTRLDLDKWLASADPTPTTPPPAGQAAQPPAAGRAPGSLPAVAPSRDVTVKLVFDAAELVYNGGVVRKVVADATLENGQLGVRRIEALLPGNTQLAGSMTASADGKSYSGDVSLAGPRLRETLAWLKVDVAQVPADKLAAFAFKGRLQSAAGGALSLSDTTVQLDGMTVRGNATLGLGIPLRITADLQADTIDIDAYLPRRAATGTPAGKAGPAAPSDKSAAGVPAPRPAPSLALVDARIKAKVARIVYNGERIEAVDADVTWRDGRLTFGETRIGNVAGAAVSLKGSIANLMTVPRVDLAVIVQTSDGDRLLRLAGVASPVKGPLGAVSMQGGVAGTPGDLAFRDFSINALGASLKMTGKVAPGAGNLRYDLTAFSFQTNDLDKVLTAFGSDKAGDGIGSVSVSGAAKGDSRNVAFNGTFTAKGVQGNGSVTAVLGGPVPRIVARLKTSELNIDQLTGSGGGQPGAAGQGGGGGRHSRAPINLAFMKNLEADVDIAAPAISKAPWRLENAALKATLKGGVLTIARLSGGVYGGNIEIAGTVNAQNATFEARLNAANINLGTAARTLGDTKRVDGVITTNLALSGSLASTADLIASLNGDGKVGGSVRFNASASEQVGGQIAGGVLKGLGKQIDKMTGGAGGIGDELGDLRAALKVANERFANRNGAVAGTITIRNGQLHTGDLRVNGQRAWAITEADVNLAAWTMVATTNVYVEENASAPYVIVRQKGPVDNPSRSIDRGPAAAGLGRQQQPSGQVPGQPVEGGQQEGQPQQQDQQQKRQSDPLRKLRKIF